MVQISMYIGVIFAFMVLFWYASYVSILQMKTNSDRFIMPHKWHQYIFNEKNAVFIEALLTRFIANLWLKMNMLL